MKHDLERGLDLWADLSQALNLIALEHGEIPRGDKTIWKNYLNRWGNREWFDILSLLAELQLQEPTAFQPFHNRALNQAARILVSDHNLHPRVLDTKGNKEHLWRLAMTLREVWNNLNKLNTPAERLLEVK